MKVDEEGTNAMPREEQQLSEHIVTTDISRHEETSYLKQTKVYRFIFARGKISQSRCCKLDMARNFRHF